VVAPGIAEALIATAMGLAAAIPAVVAYNYYLARARRMIIEMEDFSEDIRAFLLGRPHEG
jgi:biopolymer transport protein TolQ